MTIAMQIILFFALIAEGALTRLAFSGTEKLKKFDYTSYDDNIPYYTMIVYENKEKIKLLLDLNDSMLEAVKRVYPQKVYMR